MSLFKLSVFNKKIKAPWSKYYKEGAMNIEVPNQSVYNYFESKVSEFKNSYCLDYYGNKVKYDELLNKIDICSKGLYDAGVRKGDVVTVCLPNTLEGIISFFAINKIGAIVNFIHPSSSENEIKDSLNETNSRVLILIDTNYIKLKNIEKDIKVCRVILVSLYGYMPFATKILRRFEDKIKIDFSEINSLYIFWNIFLLRSQKLYVDNYIVNGEKEDPAIILHSGGTTGTSKGVVLSNKNLLSYVEISKVAQEYLVKGDVFLTLMPIFHGFGIIYGVLFPLSVGMYVVIRPKFEVKEYCKMIIKHKPQVLAGVPTLFESLLKEWKDSDVKLDFLKCALVGGDSLKPLLRKKINTFFKKHDSDVRVIEGYGLSEAVCGVVQGIKEVEKTGTTGIPLPGLYVGIFSSEDEEVPYGEEGEICVCGPTVMLGYYNNDKETNIALHTHKDGNLWLHTGDLGSMDEDGFITYTSRLKRMIISSGYNVYPNRIEELLESHPAVNLCSVVGIPHRYKMEVPKAYIVLNKKHSKKELLIMEFKQMCRKNLPKYSWPYEYEFIDELPTTRVGKVDFRKLQENNKEDKK